MLNDKQSLLLTGLMVVGVFVCGILKILDNFIILTILTIIFFTVIINLFYLKYKPDNDLEKQNNKKE